MARHKSSAFILDASDYRETSKLLHVFCENEGRISLIAKGLRSPKSRNAALADSFNLVQITYTLKENATLGILTAIEGEQTFSSLRSRLSAYALANYWFETIKVAGQARVSSAELFALTRQLLMQLDTSSNTALPCWHFLQLFQLLGFGAQFGECGDCNSTTALVQFDLSAGTTVCSRCNNPRRRLIPLPADLSAHLARAADMQSEPDTELTADLAWAFLRFANQFLSLHLDHRFRTFAFLESIYSTSSG